MSTTTNPAVTEYLARIQVALSDLPAGEVEEIVEDIGQHLSEVAGELGEDVSVETLSERLGTPEQYASELRAAAGYPPAAEEPVLEAQGRLLARFALWALVLAVAIAFLGGLSFVERKADAIGPVLVFCLPLFLALIVIFNGRVPVSAVVELPEYQAVARAGRRIADGLPGGTVGYLRSLRPAWWLVRIVVLAAGCLVALDRQRSGQFLLAAAGIVILLWFGGRARRDGRWRWVVGPANFLAAGVALALVVAVWGSLSNAPFRYIGYEPVQSGLLLNGRSVSNVYVFGPDGKPLTEAYLYDQNGQPLAVPFYGCLGKPYGVPYNKFPLPEVQYTDKGICVESHEVPFTVAIPLSTTPTTPPSPSTGPSTPSAPVTTPSGK